MSVSYNFLLIGESGVGKSSLLNRFLTNDYSPEFASTIGIDFGYGKIYFSENNNSQDAPQQRLEVSLRIFDTSGQARFRTITDHYFQQRTDGVMIVFDVSDRPSFAEVDSFIARVHSLCPTQEKTPILIVGNKIDLQETRCVTPQEAKQKAQSWKCSYIETSVSDSICVREAFEMLVELAKDSQKQSEEDLLLALESSPPARRSCWSFLFPCLANDV
jgi:small GTP-binding protein